MKRILMLLGTILLMATWTSASNATVYNLKLGPSYATASAGTATSAEAHAGTGSWTKTFPPGPKFEFYADAATQLGGTFLIDDITSITYHTLNNVVNPSGVDFYLNLYSTPFGGGDAAWYGRRLTSEPYLTNGYVPPTLGVWNTWTTAAGPNQMTFFDSNHCGNFGIYGDPTLADIKAGSITWSTWPGNGGAGDATPFDYGALSVGIVSFQTGSGWASVASYLDNVTISLSGGDSIVLDFENTTDPLYVDDNWVGAGAGTEVAAGKFIGWNAFPTIQGAVDVAIPGGTVNVAAGTYTEQVVVSGKDLSILGAGAGSTTIVSPAILATSYATPGIKKPVVLCTGASDIRIEDLTIDGASMGNANNSFQGVAWWNAGGKLLNCDVKNVQDNPFSGVQHGVAVYAFSNTGGPYSLEVGGCNLTDFQKNGTVFASAALTVDMHDCTVVGKGQTGTTAQNGIQVSNGASATITDCDVSDIFYTGPSVVATGQLVFGPGTVDISGGTVVDCQAGTYYIDASGTITGMSTSTAASGGVGAYGVATYNSTIAPMSARRLNAASTGASARPMPQALLEDDSSGTQSPGTSINTTVTILMDGGCITGPGVAGTEGIELYSEGGPLNVTAQNLEISGWEWGIWVGGPGGASMDANHNAITGNTKGYEGAATATNLAEFNWWGHAGGPGVGGANPVVGGTVDYTPWLISGADANAGCGFTPAGDNVITPGPAPSCITPTNACITIPVGITRNTSDNVRGFSVNIVLSGTLTLCPDITEGTYLSSIGATNFQVIGTGPGAYTVDCAILGLPCGATAATGTLFNLHLASALLSGTETVTVTSVTLRDCANGPVSASAGPPLSITIDNTLPAAITNLTAAQKKTGNDADGTTVINLAFTPPGDADMLMIYRAGFGDYPEYDDGGLGSVPATPSYPPPAPWVLAATIAGTSTTYADETTSRDFWYYVIFSKDACGNVSLVSNKTTGTLNYHLGDTHDGFTNCVGNNIVNTADISHLGGNYGVTGLPYGDPRNCLDVGPTTDFSVDARPTTDNKIQFEDLIMFAINHGTVSKPWVRGAGSEATTEALKLVVPELPAVGLTFEVQLEMSAGGSIQGVTTELAYDHSIVEMVGVEAGDLMSRQGGTSLVLSAGPGSVDAAVFGHGATIHGDGDLARVTFRVLAEGKAGITIQHAEGRDTENHKVALNAEISDVGTGLVAHTFLGANYPNPFMASTLIPLGLARGQEVNLSVFDVTGRLVRTLVNGALPAGERVIEWNGRDDSGRAAASGFYVIRLVTGNTHETRTVKIVR